MICVITKHCTIHLRVYSNSEHGDVASKKEHQLGAGDGRKIL